MKLNINVDDGGPSDVCGGDLASPKSSGGDGCCRENKRESLRGWRGSWVSKVQRPWVVADEKDELVLARKVKEEEK